MIKRFFFLIVLPLLVLLSHQSARAQDSLGIVAVVNDDIISAYDLGARLGLAILSASLPNTPQTAQRLAPRVLQSMIDEKLRVQEAARLGITLDERELDNGIIQIERRNNLPPGGMAALLKEKGLPFQSLSDQVEAEILWIKVVNATLRAGVKVGDDEINEAIEAIKANQGNLEYWLFEIFLQVENPEKSAEAKAFADRLLSQIKQGAPFRGIARTFSGGTTAASGGDMGWVRMDQLDSELRRAVAGMNPGDITAPIPSLGGYHILHLKDRQTAKGLELDSGVVELEQVFLPLGQNADAAEISRQTQTAQSLTADANSCSALREAGLKTGSTLSGGLGKVQVTDLPTAIDNATRDLPVNTPSEPIQVEGGVVVLMVCTRDQQGDGLESLRAKIRAQTLNRKLAIAAEKRLRDLRRDAFLDVRR